MKKIRKSHIFAFLLGAVLFGFIGAVSATILYQADEIGFTPDDPNWNVNNLESALNYLYANRENNGEFTYITGQNNRNEGITSYTIEHDNDNAIIVTGQGSMSYALNQTTNFTLIDNKLESSDYNGRATYYTRISVKKGDILNVSRDSSSLFGYVIVY